MRNAPTTGYESINYYNEADETYTATMQYLHWFRFFVRNSLDYIRAPSPDSRSQFPNRSVRLFFIMRSDEQTHIPATYEVTGKQALTYLQWCELLDDGLLSLAEREIAKVLKREVRPGDHLEWNAAEFIGWTTDGLVQNPEENKQAFRLTGNLSKPVRQVRDSTYD